MRTAVALFRWATQDWYSAAVAGYRNLTARDRFIAQDADPAVIERQPAPKRIGFPQGGQFVFAEDSMFHQY